MIFKQGFVLLIQMIFGFYIYCLMLRLWMQKFRANASNPLSQFVIRITRYSVKPFQRWVPGFKGFDFAIILLMFLLQWIEVSLSYFILTSSFPFTGGVVIVVVGRLLSRLINFFFILVIGAAILSWFPSHKYNPMAEIVNVLTRSLFGLCRRFIPLIAGLDLTPLIILVGCQVLLILVVNPIVGYGLITMLKGG